MIDFIQFLDSHSGSLTFIVTAVYVVATIIICWANIKSTKETKEQKEESIRQFNETNRPYVTCEYILSNRVFCGIRICNHGKQVARNLTIQINKEFVESLKDSGFKNFKRLNESIYSVVGIEQSFNLYFAYVKNKPIDTPLILHVNYEGNCSRFDETFIIDLAKQLPIESVDANYEKYMELIKEQNSILKSIANNLDAKEFKHK